MLYDGSADLFRILVVGTLSYLALVVSLRISGKRTLAQMNAFDFIVTVALGSTLATALLSSEVSLAEGVLALVVLITLQFLIASISVRWPWSERMAKSEPAMLLYRGRALESALRRERVTKRELHAALRAAGVASEETVYAVVLETNGAFSVVSKPDVWALSTLEEVRHPNDVDAGCSSQPNRQDRHNS